MTKKIFDNRVFTKGNKEQLVLQDIIQGDASAIFLAVKNELIIKILTGLNEEAK